MLRPRYRELSSWVTVGIVGIAILALGCTEQGPTPLGQCNGPVKLTVTPSLSPTVSWMPACAVSYVAILPTSGVSKVAVPNALWQVGPFRQNLIRPPIRYGVDPFSGIEGDTLAPAPPPKPLVPGRTYFVYLLRTGPGGMDPGLAPAEVTFTPAMPPRSAAQDPAPGTYVELPPSGESSFPYFIKTIEGYVKIYADTLTISPDLTYRTSGTNAFVGPRTMAFARVGVDSLYFPALGAAYSDMYVRATGDTLRFHTDTTVSRRTDSTIYVRQ